MKTTRILMGMPISVELLDGDDQAQLIERVYDWFNWVDQTFSTYKSGSEISRLNTGQLLLKDAKPEVQRIFHLAEETKKLTHGYFDISHDGTIDPSGIVKGWSIEQAAELLRDRGTRNFYIDAGGDIAADGLNNQGQPWKVGIRNPFNRHENVKVLSISNRGVATSGSYIRGQHIYNPLTGQPADDIASLTVIGPNVYEADRFATAAYAMGPAGIEFIEDLPDYEGYMIDYRGQATMTSGLERFILN